MYTISYTLLHSGDFLGNRLFFVLYLHKSIEYTIKTIHSKKYNIIAVSYTHLELANSGILDAYGVEILGTDLTAINQAEDRELFRELMYEIKEPVPESAIVHTVEEALAFAQTIGYPLVVRPAYTLGGTGGGFVDTEEELRIITENGLKLSPVQQCLIERSIAGFKEIEYEAVSYTHLDVYKRQLVKRWKLMLSVMVSMCIFQVSWNISSVPVSIPVTQSPFIQHQQLLSR